MSFSQGYIHHSEYIGSGARQVKAQRDRSVFSRYTLISVRVASEKPSSSTLRRQVATALRFAPRHQSGQTIAPTLCAASNGSHVRVLVQKTAAPNTASDVTMQKGPSPRVRAVHREAGPVPWKIRLGAFSSGRSRHPWSDLQPEFDWTIIAGAAGWTLRAKTHVGV